MNAAIRAVVRTGITGGTTVFGIRRGFAGLLEGDIAPIASFDVGGILQRAGTMLGSARSTEFGTERGQAAAVRRLKEHRIEGLIVIGGNGSQSGAYAISRLGFPVVGVASTIDNDLHGADVTIGSDTAVNIAVEAIDRLKATASSHRKGVLVEVMGRDCGYLALTAGLAGGVEAVVLPEVKTDPEELVRQVRASFKRGKEHAIIVVAEGAYYNAVRLGRYFARHRERLKFEVRVTQLGHVQRGGRPTAFDRLLATRTGAAAVEHLVSGKHGVLIGEIGRQIAATPLALVAGKQKPADLTLLTLAHALAE
jgi:6-phosphofructokinase 1